MANRSREEATRLALKAWSIATSADTMISATIHRACRARSKATAMGNCVFAFKLCHGATNETAPITTQKKDMPAKMVSKMATEKSRSANSGLASSAHLPTDSKPDTNQGTTCHTSNTDSSGVWLNRGRKFEAEPC